MSAEVLDGFAAAVGIDWADRKHDICLQVAGSTKREFCVLEHKPEAIDDWANALRRRFDNRPVAVCLETRRGPLINALSKYEHLVLYPVNPNLLAGVRKAFSSSGAKDDPSDAALALDILLQHPEKLPAWVPEDARTRHLQALVEGRRRLIGARVRITNRLLANLKGYYPQAIECFEDIGTRMACAFLSEWPSLADARRARKATLVAFFHHHGVRDDELIAKRIALLKHGMALTTDAGVVLPSVLTTKALVAELRALLVGIGDFDDAIARVFKTHPDAFIFQSLPGAGPTFAPRLLCALGTQRERFASAAALQMYLGIAPVTERSGKSTWVHWRWACPKFLRQSIVEWAGMSRRYSLWAAAFYAEQRERGKAHNAAIRALAFKWLRILYRCWQERKPYDEVAYLRALQERGSPLLQRIAQVPPKAA